MKNFLLLGAFLMLQAVSYHSALAADKPVPPQRIVFLGDSITDGHSYPQFVQQALQQAGQPVPVVINAGIGGDNAAGMLARLERDVLVHKPTLVTVNAGANDASQKVPLDVYSRAITGIADRLKADNIPLVILTTAIYGAKLSEAEKTLDQYNEFLRSFAKARGLKVAEVNGLFQKARQEKGEASVMETDGVHPNMEGQRLYARAVLDALGYVNVAVPHDLTLQPMPGIFKEWFFAPLPENTPLDEQAAQDISLRLKNLFPHIATKGVPPTLDYLATLPPEGLKWKHYTLPETTPQEQPWMEDERQRGFGLSLDKQVGPGKLWRGAAFINSENARSAFLNTGAQLRSVWLNGEKVYEYKDWRGWHAGRDRIPVTIKAGTNAILIETAGPFFLSVTDRNDW